MRKNNLVRVVMRLLKAFIKLKGDVTKDNYQSFAKRLAGQLDAVYTIEKRCNLTFSPARSFSNIRKLIDKGYYSIYYSTDNRGYYSMAIHIVNNIICATCERQITDSYAYVCNGSSDSEELCIMCNEIFKAMKLDVIKQIEKSQIEKSRE